MHKWIQRAEKPLEHSDYTNLATQICRSNHSSLDFGQNQTEKVTGKQPKVERLDYCFIIYIKLKELHISMLTMKGITHLLHT
jgi:hypothetical protein